MTDAALLGRARSVRKSRDVQVVGYPFVALLLCLVNSGDGEKQPLLGIEFLVGETRYHSDFATFLQITLGSLQRDKQ